MTHLTVQLLDFLCQRITLRLRPAPLGSQRLANTTSSFSPPSGQQRGVQTFPTKESTDSTACRRSGFGFFEDALLIFCGAAKSRDLEVWGCFRSPPPLPYLPMILLSGASHGVCAWPRAGRVGQFDSGGPDSNSCVSTFSLSLTV